MRTFIQKLKDYIKHHYVKLLIIFIPLGAILFLGGLIGYNQSSKFCYTCHINEGPYAMVDKTSPAHKDIDKHLFTCIKCHKDKTVQTVYQRFFKRNKNFLENAANLSFQNIKSPRFSYTTDQCLNCHPDRLDVMDIPSYLIKSDKLRKIGLRVNKRVHHDFENYSIQDADRYNELKSKDNLTAAESKELELLEKVKTGNCGQCHQNKKITPDGKSGFDKSVNFVARNPVACTGCHEDVDPTTHPGSAVLKFPTEEVCQKCHHGQLHGKFVIFKAECEDTTNTENCIKCHPNYQKSQESETIVLR